MINRFISNLLGVFIFFVLMACRHAFVFKTSSCLSTSSVKRQCATSHLWVSRNGETPLSNHENYRRSLLKSIWLTMDLFTATTFGQIKIANAMDLASSDVFVESMKSFIDPLGLFSVIVPTRFYTVRRTAKGDLPDEKTGKGRRGSSIFSAGDMTKTEVVAIERYPTRILLEENGIDPTGSSLSTFPDIGEPYAIANLITLRREMERPGGLSTTKVIQDSVRVSDDGKDLYFTLRTPISVQKPELLLEQTGLTELVRITVVKSTLRSNDGNILTIFASALETDFKGPDGKSLDATINSFQALDRSNSKL